MSAACDVAVLSRCFGRDQEIVLPATIGVVAWWTLAQLLGLPGTACIAAAGVVLCFALWGCKSHSRPYVSDDNPYSEAQFKTLKYRPDFPDRFGSIEDARAHCKAFFDWYNTEHRHSGIGFMTPETVHMGRAAELTRQRSITLDAAFMAHPERFKHVAPSLPEVPRAAWINPPKKKVTTPAQPSTLAL